MSLAKTDLPAVLVSKSSRRLLAETGAWNITQVVSAQGLVAVARCLCQIAFQEASSLFTAYWADSVLRSPFVGRPLAWTAWSSKGSFPLTFL